MNKRYNLNSKNREMLAAIGKHLQLSRERMHMSISKLSKISGVSRATLYAAERGDVTFYLIIWVYVKLCNTDIYYINNYINSNIQF